eukprot:GFKZ01016046.1.p2 GENE.GFKZ01016046.1~~GFKZ01016046.1.p2  ORF type:complete len:105 (+),score=6.23 GFKZ01016046.1:571-885(+)
MNSTVDTTLPCSATKEQSLRTPQLALSAISEIRKAHRDRSAREILGVLERQRLRVERTAQGAALRLRRRLLYDSKDSALQCSTPTTAPPIVSLMFQNPLIGCLE